MKLIVGLGNPGKKFQYTRHNAGYIFVDLFRRSKVYKKHKKDVLVLKTKTFMNESGKKIKELCQKHNVLLDNLFVVYDDLDIALGNYKIQKGKSPKDHKGILSVNEALGSNYWHIRLGIENRRKMKIKGEKYVLSKFDKSEMGIFKKTIKEVIEILDERFL